MKRKPRSTVGKKKHCYAASLYSVLLEQNKCHMNAFILKKLVKEKIPTLLEALPSRNKGIAAGWFFYCDLFVYGPQRGWMASGASPLVPEDSEANNVAGFVLINTYQVLAICP